MKNIFTSLLQRLLKKEDKFKYTVYTFKVGDKVIFDPGERSIGNNYETLKELNLRAGDIVEVEKITKDYVYVRDTGFPGEQFIPYTEGETATFKVGDVVKFTPSDRTAKRSWYSVTYSPLKPGTEGKIKEIRNSVWVLVDDDRVGYYWKDYTLVKKAE